MQPESRRDACNVVIEFARRLLAGRVTIRAARVDELETLVDIERAAAATFRALSMDLVADDDPGSVPALTPYAEDGRAFVAVDGGDRPIAYLLLDVVDGVAHIEQVSVHPDYARRGIGRSLIERAASWASARSLPAITLTTYVDVPWNAPYYERLGFEYLATDDETPGLRMLRRHERDVGLDAWPRTSMRRELAGPREQRVIRNAFAHERTALESLQHRSSNVWEQYREQLRCAP